jgi:carboxymethylenebutenolidase
MIERFVKISTNAGRMETFIAHPSENGPFPAVVLYMDIWGLREELFDIARHVASVGYCVLVPDLYYREGKVRHAFYDASNRMLSFQALSEEQKREVLAPLRKLKDEMVLEDTAALIDHVEADTAAKPGAMGCLGYCLGGRLILRVAGAFPERFRACAGMHGTDLVTDKPDSPHLAVRSAQGELYMGFGELDMFSPPAVIEAFAKTLGNRAFRYRYTVHKGIHHGYGLPDRDVYDKQASLTDWENIFAMLHRQIPPSFGS